MDVLNCTPGNFDRADGEKNVIVTVANHWKIEQQAFRMRDARMLVSKTLIALATNDDDFALRLLHEHFPADKDGNFYWPREAQS